MTLKKFLIILACVLAVALIIFLTIPYEHTVDSVTFYYVKNSFSPGTPEGVIGAEQREVGGHEGDLDYLLALYLGGPMDAGLTSPFPGPSATRILTLKQDGPSLTIQLSDLSNSMTDSEFSLACACLTKTCMGLTEARTVRITSGDRSVKMNADNLVFFDESSSVFKSETEETK